ncbi:MAG: hypothetical protein HYW27_04350 [Candidatus Aenigmarchaeota archaeon]|nr:hypothetical protein [Candidatus Aenigmarchaeota archaeon]
MKNLVPIYAVLVLASLAYLFAVEDINGDRFAFNGGGRDAKLSFYDLSIIGVTAFSGILTILSTLAHGRKRTRKLFLISMAFFIFTLKSAFSVIFNHFIGDYYLMGVLIQGMELLVLLIFSSVLLFSEPKK